MDQFVKAHENPEQKVEILQARIAELEEKLKESEARASGEESRLVSQVAIDQVPDHAEDVPKDKPLQDVLIGRDINTKRQLAELDLVYKTAPVGLCFMDTHRRFIRINQTLATLNGHSVEAHLGRTLEEIFPQLAPSLLPIYQTVLDTKKAVLNLEICKAPNKDTKQERDWLMCYFPVIEDETVLGITTVVQDITDRKHTERLLTRSRDWHVHLLDNIPALIWRSGLDGKCDYFNQAWLDFTGGTLEQELGDGWIENVFPEDRPNCLATYTKSFQTRQPFEMEYRLRRGDGTYGWIIDVGHPFNDLTGNFAGYIGSCHDISQRKHAEKILRESEEKFRLLVEGIHDYAIFMLDPQGNVASWNPGAKRIKGYQEKEILGKHFSCFYPDEDIQQNKPQKELGAALDLGSVEDEGWRIRKDGSRFWANVIITALRDESGSLRGYSKITRVLTERKRAENAIQDSERRYRSLFEHATVCLHEIDLHGRLLTMNPVGLRMLGVQDCCEIEGTLYLDTVAPQDKDRIECLLGAAFQGEPANFEFTAAGLDKSKKLSSSFIPVKNSNGQVIKLMGITQDITDRKAAEAALQISENSIRTLYEVTSSRHLTFEQKIRSLLELGCQRLGLPYGTLTKRVGEHLELEFLHAPDQSWIEHTLVPICNSFCSLTLEREDPLVFEHAGQSIWGTYPAYKALGLEAYIGTKVVVGRTVYGSLCFLDRAPYSGKFTSADQDFLQLMARWIGSELERQQAETAVQDNERRFRMVCEAIPQQVWTAQPDGALDYVNQRVLEFFQQPFEQMIERGWHDVIHPDDLPLCRKRWEESRQTNQPYEIEFRLKRGSDETYRPHIGRALPVFNQEGHVMKWFGTNTDITDFKRMETQLRQAQKMEAIGTLAGGIAHDFNNVLGVILGYAELAQHKASENEALGKNLREITVAGKRAKDLVHHILTFGRQEEIFRKPIDLNFHIRDVLKMVRATLPSTITIQSKVSNEAVSILGDLTQLQQVVLNLCSNAEHAMRDKGGLLEVGMESLELEKSKSFGHVTLPPGRYIRLWVQDSGHGMPQNMQNRIFDPFFTTKGVGEGTGMGLAVVHGIVTGHHGAISVQSQVGQGTTFEIYLPALELNNESQGQADSQKVSLKKPARVLFVDDEMPLAYFGKEVLETLGCEVDICTNGLEALECFQKDPSRYDVVISDQTMPGMTGEKLAQQLLELRSDLPIILCTGFSHAMTAEKAEQIGIQAFLKKPVLKEDLIQTLNKLLCQGASS